jgi:hypothetical protein
MNNRLSKILFSGLIIGLPIFATVEAKAGDHTDMAHSEMEMEQSNDSVEPESGAYDSIDGGYDGEPVVTIPQTEGTIDVIVKNNTNAAIDYQAIGFTENQTLEGGEEYTMQGLPVPVVIRAARQDDGFVTTEPMINDDGVLEVALDEAGERNLGVVRIEEDGSVYINQDSEAGMDSESDMSPEEMDMEDMQPESRSKENMDMSSDAIESDKQSPVYNNTDGGYDGEPIATVIPTEETINVRLKNNTNAAIDYQAVGYTENQTLEGGEKHTMVNLPVPVVIRSARQDDGFIKILPLTNEDKDGILEVSLDEDPDFYDDDNIGVLRIEEDGSVYIN